MSTITPTTELAPSFDSFGPFLRYLRKRARLTQRDLGIAVGYSIAQICLLEKGQRLPELTTIAALFVPALDLQDEPDLVARLLQLAAAAHGGPHRMTVMRTVHREVTLREVEVTPPANLPAPLTSFVGRERELDSLRTMLANPTIRLITLLGPPGVGKTRLALQLAWENYRDFADGAWFVDLVAIREPALVAAAIRAGLGIREPSTPEAEAASLKKHLGQRNLLLVLDNLEQVLPAAPLLTDLLVAAPHLKILTTSREPLDLYGENEFRVAPLPVPDLARWPSVDQLAQVPSVALFAERARAVKTDFDLSPANAPAVAAICVRLDGLPLALELAAAQVKHYDLAELASHLVQRLSLLGRKALPRRQTVRATIDWSYKLLTEAERTLLRRVSVFPTGFALEAVQAICSDQRAEDAVHAGDALNLLMHLVAKSLVLMEGSAGEQRYRLLETIREYASEKLERCGEEEQTRRRQVDWFTQLAEKTEDLVTGADQKLWLDRLEAEHDNFRATLQWSLDGNDPDNGLKMAAALFRFWMVHGHHMSEGRRWLARALEASRSTPSLARARVLRGLAGLELNQGKLDVASEHYRECLSIFQHLDDKNSIAIVTANLGNALRCAGHYDEARAYLEASLAAHRELNVPFYVGYCLWSLAGIAHEQQDDVEAQRLNEQALLSFRQVGNRQYIAATYAQQGMVAAASGRYEESGALFRQALDLLRELDDPLGILQLLEALAYLAVTVEEPERGATLLGAVESARSESGIYWHLFNREYEATVTQVQALLGPETLERAGSRGRAMELEEAIEYARAA